MDRLIVYKMASSSCYRTKKNDDESLLIEVQDNNFNIEDAVNFWKNVSPFIKFTQIAFELRKFMKEEDLKKYQGVKSIYFSTKFYVGIWDIEVFKKDDVYFLNINTAMIINDYFEKSLELISDYGAGFGRGSNNLKHDGLVDLSIYIPIDKILSAEFMEDPIIPK